MVGGAGFGVEVERTSTGMENLKLALHNLVVDPDERQKYSLLSRARYTAYFQRKQYLRKRMVLIEEVYKRYHYSFLIVDGGAKVIRMNSLFFVKMG